MESDCETFLLSLASRDVGGLAKYLVHSSARDKALPVMLFTIAAEIEHSWSWENIKRDLFTHLTDHCINAQLESAINEIMMKNS